MSDHKYYQAIRTRRKIVRMVILLVLMVLIIASVGALAYVSGRMLTGKPVLDDMLLQYNAADTLVVQQGEDVQAEQEILEDEVVNLWNQSVPVATTLSYETVGVDDKMFALPQNGRVSLDYFSTAMFVGDSLSQGFNDYAGNLSITPIPAAFKGATPQGLVENSTASYDADYPSVPMWDYITQQTPDSIYIGMGANALVATDDDEAFLHYYGVMLDALRSQFPGVPIYLMSITPVTAAAEAERPRLANSRIENLNDVLSLMAMERGIHYLDIHEVLEDENGYLRADLEGYDGLHLSDYRGYQIWLDYLATHTVYSPLNTQYLLEPYGA